MDLKKINELATEYENSIFELGLRPEYNIGEVSLASLYRQVGWQEKKEKTSKRYGEARVNTEASNFFRNLENENQILGYIKIQDWKKLVKNAISTPKMPNQAKTKNPILYPYVPDCTLYSSAARLRGNPWNPGNLIEKTILIGAGDINKAKDLWRKIFEALSSDYNDQNEDILSRIVSKEFELRRPDDVRWDMNEISQKVAEFDDNIIENSPAKQLFNDIEKILILKPKLTRRQWLSTLESVLRIGCAGHILWVCNLNDQLWTYLKRRYEGVSKSDLNIVNMLTKNANEFWKLEERAVGVIKEQVQAYIRAQIAINYILKKLNEEGENYSLNSYHELDLIGDILEVKRRDRKWDNLITEINDCFDSQPGLIVCKSGFTRSIFEFIRHSLGQKQTAESHKRNFDQSYWLRKKANYSAAPWIVDLGPTSILTMIYCCSHGYDQNRTIKDFLLHLKQYGFIIEEKDLINSNLMTLLSTLQVVGDSPDAEGGMVIINPFN